MSLRNYTLVQALAAMNELNSFARAQHGAAPRRAIYWLKSRYAIRDAIMAGMLAQMRAVQVTTKCRKCSNGIYTDWDGIPRGTCYDCKGTATVTLRFIETQINTDGDKYTWHTPVNYSSWLGWPADDLVFAEAQDWTVQQPGKPFTAVELATHMNTVEWYWTQWRRHSPCECSRDESDCSRYYIFNYSLDLGHSAQEEGCVLCGGAHKIYCGLTVCPGLSRSLSVCEPCAKGGSATGDLWKRLASLPIPQLHPEIQFWRERHALDFEKSWSRLPCDHVMPSDDTSPARSGLFRTTGV